MKTPVDMLRNILTQRGKTVSAIQDPFQATMLKYLRKIKNNRDFLYCELSDRKKRNEILYSIYRNEVIKFSNGIEIQPTEGSRNVYSATFEWYVAELLYREFHFVASASGIKIDGSPEGGDFDVIGATHAGIIAIECKSGKPRGIDESQIIQFVRRHNFLRADYSLMYIDYKGLEGKFPFSHLAKAVHGSVVSPKVYRVNPQGSESNANFYAVEGANIYIVDNSINTGNVIKNLRFAFDTHQALRKSQHRNYTFDKQVLKEAFDISMEPVS
jgi:hypothetical protein